MIEVRGDDELTDLARAEERVRIVRDTRPPRLLVDHINKAALSYTAQQVLRVSLGADAIFVGGDGEVRIFVQDEALARVLVNGVEPEAEDDGVYRLRLPPSSKAQELVVVAEDRAGNRAEARHRVYGPAALR